MLLSGAKMLKKRLGTEAIENGRYLRNFFIIPSSLIISEGCECIEISAFEGCWGLKKVVIPKSVKWIGYYAFCNCRKLKEVIISEGVKRVMDWAFYSCPRLEKVVIPESVKEINNWAFGGCTSAEITIENTEKSIVVGRCVFDGCRKVRYAEEETRD